MINMFVPHKHPKSENEKKNKAALDLRTFNVKQTQALGAVILFKPNNEPCSVCKFQAKRCLLCFGEVCILWPSSSTKPLLRLVRLF